MARRGKRRQIAPNIFEDATGLSVKVTIGGRTRERRFPRGTPLEELEDQRDQWQRHQAVARPALRGTLHADVVAYLRTIGDTRKRTDQQRLCAHWLVAHGHASRFALRPLAIRQQLAAWREAGAAASSCNHRLSALRSVFAAVNTPDEINYAAQVKKLPEPEPEPRALPDGVVERILAAMPHRSRPVTGQPRGTVSLTRLRCAVWAYTGLPPSQMARIQARTDIDWAAGMLRARPRRKGRGTRAAWVELLPEGLAALRALHDAGGLGLRFSTSALHASFLRACRTVIREQLAGGEEPLPHRVDEDGTIVPLVRPYDLRHTFGTAVLAASNDLAATQHLLQHSTPTQTQRYVLRAVPQNASRAIQLLARDRAARGVQSPDMPPRCPTPGRKSGAPNGRTRRKPRKMA